MGVAASWEGREYSLVAGLLGRAAVRVCVCVTVRVTGLCVVGLDLRFLPSPSDRDGDMPKVVPARNCNEPKPHLSEEKDPEALLCLLLVKRLMSETSNGSRAQPELITLITL